ncbi:MAG: hypothetical protein BroJett011_11660 [Chloroflexota bacterium]|nr:MAG: hypothetical protein BroJett011_11660 [Chloroflexota bacterium]
MPPIPEEEIPTALSDRWQRCGWMQACGIVQSWYSNERTNRPILRNLCIQANTNVVKIEQPEKASSFDLLGNYKMESVAEVGGAVVIHASRLPIQLQLTRLTGRYMAKAGEKLYKVRSKQ